MIEEMDKIWVPLEVPSRFPSLLKSKLCSTEDILTVYPDVELGLQIWHERPYLITNTSNYATNTLTLSL